MVRPQTSINTGSAAIFYLLYLQKSGSMTISGKCQYLFFSYILQFFFKYIPFFVTMCYNKSSLFYIPLTSILHEWRFEFMKRKLSLALHSFAATYVRL